MLGHTYALNFITLHLSPEDIQALVLGRLDSNDKMLRGYFPDFEEWPADAQLATHSMGWAVGPAFADPKAGKNHWPKLTAALRARDFNTAAIECFMKEEKTISGLRPRNKANKILYTNAAIVMTEMDPETLYYPRDLKTIGVDPEGNQAEAVCKNCGGTLKLLKASDYEMTENQYGCDACGAMFTAAGAEIAMSPSNFAVVHPKVPLGNGED